MSPNMPPFVLDPSLELSDDCFFHNVCNLDGVSRFQEAFAARTEEEHCTCQSEIDLEAQEERDHQQALQETRAALTAMHSSYSLVSPSPPPASTSQSIPQCTSTSQSIPPHPSTSQPMMAGSSTWLLILGVLVTKVISTKKPTITTQMNPTWMWEFKDRLHETPSVVLRGQQGVAVEKRFQIVYWALVGEYMRSSILFSNISSG